MNVFPGDGMKIVRKIAKKINKNKKISNLDIVYCPSFLGLADMSKLLNSRLFKNYFLGAQNCFWQDKGNFTGEVSPAWLAKTGCKYVILGHSERMRELRETGEMIQEKIKAVVKNKMTPVVCVGETLDDFAKGINNYVVLDWLIKVLSGVKITSAEEIIIAYEPSWAIGTGRAIRPSHAEYMSKIIKQAMIDIFPLKIVQNNIRIIYGGSVNSKNISSFVAKDLIDGVLIGRASLDPKEFIKMCELII